MSKKQAFRHGEILFIKTDSIPKEAILQNTKVFLEGSHGNPHSFKGGKFYKFEKDFIVGYLEAKNTKLYHSEHSPNGCELPNGFYEVRKGQEYINEEMKPIID